MNIMKRLIFFALLVLVTTGWVGAQNRVFTAAGAEEDLPEYVTAEPVPAEKFSRLILDNESMWSQLANVPAAGETGRQVYLELPTPDGEWMSVRVEDSPVMHPELAARYPNIKSYRAYTDFGMGRIAVSPQGMTAALVGEQGDFYISEAVSESNVHHVAYYRSDMDISTVASPTDLACGWDPDEAADDLLLDGIRHPGETVGSSRSVDDVIGMYVYDLALTCTGEFASLKGGTLSSVMAAFNESVSLLNAVLESETASMFQLVANNDDLIFLDSGTDPFTNSNMGGALLGQVENAIVNFGGVPLNTFDLGHCFTGGCTDVGGVVSGRACTPGKTRGITCHYTNSIPAIVNRVMTHEIAHQFAVGHSWNNCPPSSGQLASGSAFEPGSGTTIMSYAGSCGSANNVANGSDNYYHVGSLDQFYEYTRVVVPECATILDATNTVPKITLDYEDGFFIPISTPFELTGTAVDADGDELTYCWEQYDLGPSRDLGDPSGNSPLFRSYPPSTDGATRVFPRLNRIINNTSSNVEVLPTYTRDMTFRLTARDNNPDAGASVWETVAFHATEQAGPFLVNYPNDGTEELSGGQYVEVIWDVANTNQAPVNCQRVNIRLSLDGGQTYPVMLLENAANTGSVFVTIPADIESNTARVRIEAADNIFFDISNQNFSVVAPTEPGFTLTGPQYYEDVCLPAVITATYEADGFLGFEGDIDLSIQEDLLPAGITAELTNTTVTPGQSSTITIDLTNSDYDGLLDVVLEASLGDTFTTTRVITLDVVNNDYSDLELLTPVEGDQSIQLATEFGWSDAQYADRYDFQLATSPDFAPENIIEESLNQAATDFEPADFFDVNTIYYWRVRASNECGPGDWEDPRTFRTANVECVDFASTDTPLLLPGSFTERISELFVENNGSISDVNIPNIDLTFLSVSDLTLTLESPMGTQVILYEEDCSGITNSLNLGFDDDAPNNVACPPDDQRVFLPKEPLSAFIGENTFGTWKLIINSSQAGQTGGLNSWDIQFCAGINAEAPFITRNEVTYASPLENEVIRDEELRVQDNNFGASEVVFTLVRAPRYGVLNLDGEDIEAGATFTQQDIYDWSLRYRHTIETELIDDFAFVAVNPDGGYISVNYHDIEVNAVLDVNEAGALSNNAPEIFPNPVNNNLQIRWNSATTEPLPTQLLDVTGRVLRSFNIPARISNFNLEVSELPAGVYFLKVGSHTERIVKR